MRHIPGLLSAVAALQAGEQHATRDLESIRREVHESEARLMAKIVEVDNHCGERFKDATAGFNATIDALKGELKDERTGKRSVTVAWIGLAALLAASTISSIAVVLSGT